MIQHPKFDDGVVSTEIGRSDMNDFGKSFKDARLAQGLTLEHIALETKISTRFLEAIEEERFTVLPGGIFNRGFIRTYASRLGLDPDDAVARYRKLAEPREFEPILPPVPEAYRSNRNPHEKYLYAGALVALVVGVMLFYAISRPAPPPVPATSGPALVSPVPAGAPPSAPESAPVTLSPDESAAAQPAMPASVALDSAGASGLAIEMQVQEPTWISISADGKVLTSEVLQPGTTKKFTAHESIGLKIGNAGGLQLKINDQTVPPLGRSGQVKSLVITPGNLKDLIGSN